MFEVLQNGNWVTGEPVTGELCRETMPQGFKTVYVYGSGQTPPPPPRITELAMRRRFTSDEWLALDMAAMHDASQPKNSTDNVNAAKLRLFLEEMRSAQFVDFRDPNLTPALDFCVSLGILQPNRPAEITTAPIQDHERP